MFGAIAHHNLSLLSTAPVNIRRAKSERIRVDPDPRAPLKGRRHLAACRERDVSQRATTAVATSESEVLFIADNPLESTGFIRLEPRCADESAAHALQSTERCRHAFHSLAPLAGDDAHGPIWCGVGAAGPAGSALI